MAPWQPRERCFLSNNDRMARAVFFEAPALFAGATHGMSADPLARLAPLSLRGLPCDRWKPSR
jgi:hypothetical protein